MTSSTRRSAQDQNEQIEDIMSAISEMGVNIVENQRFGRRRRRKPSPRKRSTRSTTASRPAVATKKEAGRPHRRPGPHVPARDGRGGAFPRRRDRHRQAHRGRPRHDDLGPVRSPITFNAIIEWSNALNEGTMQLREILDLEAMLSKGPTAEQINESEEGGGEGEGEISAAVAGPAFKEEEEPEEEEAAPPTTKTTWSSAAPSRSPKRKTTTTPSPSPRWKRR